MSIFDVLSLIGGLCLFLFGMNVMGQSLERAAGNKLRSLLGKLTNSKLAGFLTGMGVTAIIQSSSATTVMVVGFVNSGLMSLKQSINVIMGANVGTTITAWILSLGGIGSDNFFVKMLKPTSFTPILALIGIAFYMFGKTGKKKDAGTILLGFATLMFGMDAMSGAVSGLADMEGFRNLFLMFKNPFLGMLAGALLTAVIQSSSASVGILQALAFTGQVSYGAAVPIIMGQNIGTCITAMLSSTGATKSAKRAALVHLSFNIIGTVAWLTVFSVADMIFHPALLDDPANSFGIAICHSIFNVLCTLLLLPMGGLLEKIVTRLVPDAKTPEQMSELDERLLNTPPLALASCRTLSQDMAYCAVSALKDSMSALTKYTPQLAESVRANEEQSDHYEDVLGTYLVKLSSRQISEADSREAAMLLKMIGDFERISDHSVNILESIEELREKELEFSEFAMQELSVLTGAVNEILDLTLKTFLEEDTTAALLVDPLEQVIDDLKEKMRSQHISRLQQGGCSIEAGFIWSDLLTNFERTSDHCSNIAGGVIDRAQSTMNIHESLRTIKKTDAQYKENYEMYSNKFALEK